MTPTHPAVAAAGRIEQLRRSDPSLRRRVLDVRRWALGRGIPGDTDGLTVVVGTLFDAERRDGTDPARWDTERVAEFVWLDAPRWCRHHRIALPAGTADALRLWWAFLDAHGGPAEGSDGAVVLERTLRTHTGHRRNGRSPVPREHKRHG